MYILKHYICNVRICHVSLWVRMLHYYAVSCARFRNRDDAAELQTCLSNNATHSHTLLTLHSCNVSVRSGWAWPAVVSAHAKAEYPWTNVRYATQICCSSSGSNSSIYSSSNSSTSASSARTAACPAIRFYHAMLPAQQPDTTPNL